MHRTRTTDATHLRAIRQHHIRRAGPTLLTPGGAHEAPAPRSHAELVASARRIRTLALDGVSGSLVDAVRSLLHDLVVHARHEDPLIERFPGATAVVTREGHQRIVDLTESAMQAAVAGESCLAGVRAAELEQLLRRQAQLEAACAGRLRRV